MFIQGDVLAVLGLLIGSCVSAWALTMVYGLLFPRRSQLAKAEVAAHPWKCIGRGLLIVLTLGVVGVILIGTVPNPVAKLFGWVVVLGILAISALGMAGIGFTASDRLREMAPDINPYAAFCRGSAYLIVACILPIVGWLAFGPILLLASIGAGFKVAFIRIPAEDVLTPVEAV